MGGSGGQGGIEIESWVSRIGCRHDGQARLNEVEAKLRKLRLRYGGVVREA